MRGGTRYLLAVVAMALSACAAPREQSAGDDSGPAEVFERARARRAEPVTRHLMYGRACYYVASPCRDLHNPLYDAQDQYVCAPDGGFTGRGDQRCPADIRVDSAAGVLVPNPFYER
jgi:hypothetical protein